MTIVKERVVNTEMNLAFEVSLNSNMPVLSQQKYLDYLLGTLQSIYTQNTLHSILTRYVQRYDNKAKLVVKY